MILFIDTSDLNRIKFAIITDSSVKSKTIKLAYHENYKTLEHLEKFLKANGIILNSKFHILDSIFLCSGPGSFTGLRVAASIAQAWAFALKIPLTAIKKSQIPKNLKSLIKMHSKKKVTLDYGRPAIY